MGYGHRRRILIYVSGGGNEGMGHIIRSSHLANLLQEMGADVLFSYPEVREALIPDWMRCPRSPVPMDPLRQINPVLAADFPLDLFVLDVMFPKDEWVQAAPKSVVIVGAGWAITKEVAAAARLLVYQTGFPVFKQKISGAKYLMLGPAYKKRGEDKTDDVLISFGAGIPPEYTNALTEAFPRALMPDQGEMLYGLQRMARIHVGSMGMSTYESMAMGCVPIVVCRSTDHANTAEKMDDLGTLITCGILADAPPKMLVSVVSDVLSRKEWLQQMAKRGMDLIDGNGLQRVAREVLRV